MEESQELTTKIQQNLETKTKLKEAKSDVSAKVLPPIQKNEINEDVSNNIVQVVIPQLTNQVDAAQQQSNNNKSLEILAREIYGLVKQRIQIDRERQGSSYNRLI